MGQRLRAYVDDWNVYGKSCIPVLPLGAPHIGCDEYGIGFYQGKVYSSYFMSAMLSFYHGSYVQKINPLNLPVIPRVIDRWNNFPRFGVRLNVLLI
jgi:hypothetical protein